MLTVRKIAKLINQGQVRFAWFDSDPGVLVYIKDVKFKLLDPAKSLSEFTNKNSIKDIALKIKKNIKALKPYDKDLYVSVITCISGK